MKYCSQRLHVPGFPVRLLSLREVSASPRFLLSKRFLGLQVVHILKKEDQSSQEGMSPEGIFVFVYSENVNY